MVRWQKRRPTASERLPDSTRRGAFASDTERQMNVEWWSATPAERRTRPNGCIADTSPADDSSQRGGTRTIAAPSAYGATYTTAADSTNLRDASTRKSPDWLTRSTEEPTEQPKSPRTKSSKEPERPTAEPKYYSAKWDRWLTASELTRIDYLRGRRRRAIMQGDRYNARKTAEELYRLTGHRGFK